MFAWRARSSTVSGWSSRSHRPGEQVGERVVVAGGHRGGDELGLAAGPVRRHDEAAGDGVGDRRAVVEADQVQAQVQRGGLARGGEHAAVVDVEHVRVDLHPGMAGGQRGGVRPVRGRAPAVQQPGGGQHERARCTGRPPARPPRGPRAPPRPGRRAAPRRRRRSAGTITVSACGQPVEPVVGLQREPADPHGARAADGDVVPGVGTPAGVGAEDLVRQRPARSAACPSVTASATVAMSEIVRVMSFRTLARASAAGRMFAADQSSTRRGAMGSRQR